jgi:hypothetical protein
MRTVLINHQVYRVTITNLQNINREVRMPHMRGPVHFGMLSKLMSKNVTASINLAEAKVRKEARQGIDIAIDVPDTGGVNRTTL